MLNERGFFDDEPGNVVSGNVGTESRLEFSVIGAPVNIASRLEGTTKLYGVSIMISDETNSEISPYFFTREIDHVRLKGITKPCKIWVHIIN